MWIGAAEIKLNWMENSAKQIVIHSGWIYIFITDVELYIVIFEQSQVSFCLYHWKQLYNPISAELNMLCFLWSGQQDTLGSCDLTFCLHFVFPFLQSSVISCLMTWHQRAIWRSDTWFLSLLPPGSVSTIWKHASDNRLMKMQKWQRNLSMKKDCRRWGRRVYDGYS